jgi:hypothetical protein
MEHLSENTSFNEDGILEYLEITNVGSVKHVAIDFAKRINILAGDNGLGKTLIQEFCWWTLTQKWSESPITPRLDGTSAKSRIKYKVVGNKKGFSPYQEATFDWRKSDWVSSENSNNNPSLALYCRVDGSIATWDTTRPLKDINPIFFSREQVWNGIMQPEQGRNNYLSNGLLYDLANWQIKKSEEFDLFCKILKKLSPPDLAVGDVGQLKLGKIIRIPNDTRDIPTLEMPYGLVPIIQSSAAIKRILSIAYLIVWTWSEHKNRVKLFGGQNLSRKLVILIDELEAHLHPQWQRVILPALLEIQYFLEEELEIQFILTTHSPLVLASIEPVFDTDKDKLFHFDLDEKHQAIITEMPFQKRGTVDSWLTSELFELSLARSVESEKALNKAKEIMMDRAVHKESSELSAIHQTLLNVLNAHDPFWVRWNFFVQQKGIDV